MKINFYNIFQKGPNVTDERNMTSYKIYDSK